MEKNMNHFFSVLVSKILLPLHLPTKADGMSLRLVGICSSCELSWRSYLVLQRLCRLRIPEPLALGLRNIYDSSTHPEVWER